MATIESSKKYSEIIDIWQKEMITVFKQSIPEDHRYAALLYSQIENLVKLEFILIEIHHDQEGSTESVRFFKLKTLLPIHDRITNKILKIIQVVGA